MPGPVTIQALTWNMGNKPASKEALNDIFSQIEASPPPTVLSISTQEELAPNGKRLQDLLLAKLNEEARKKGEAEYELVVTKQPQFHTTMAGANNSARTLLRALTTNQNRVSTAILVRKPYQLKDATARIDYQAANTKKDKKDKNAKVNKSIITITGNLTDETGKTLMKISASGGHFDANKDQKRRAHANKFLERSNLKTNQPKSFNDIYQEASSFQIMTGDFNERNQLFGSTQIAKDMMKQNNFATYGFDVAQQPDMKKKQDGTALDGTYGIFDATPKTTSDDDPNPKTTSDDDPNPKTTSDDNPNPKTTSDDDPNPKTMSDNDPNPKIKSVNVPDPKIKRKHVARGGFLDRVAYASGLKVEEGKHGFTVDNDHYKPNQKGKMLYHGSDHLPVVRTFNVMPPQPKEKAEVVSNYIKRRLPDFTDDIIQLDELIKHIESIPNNLPRDKLNELLEEATDKFSIMHYDSEYSKANFIRIYAGVKFKASFEEVKAGLKAKLKTKQDIQENVEGIKAKIDAVPPNEAYLAAVFNQLNQVNDLNNLLQEIKELPEKTMHLSDKAKFIQLAQKLVDRIYDCSSETLNGNNKAKIPLDMELSMLIDKYPKIKAISNFNRMKEEMNVSLIKLQESQSPKVPPQPSKRVLPLTSLYQQQHTQQTEKWQRAASPAQNKSLGSQQEAKQPTPTPPLAEKTATTWVVPKKPSRP